MGGYLGVEQGGEAVSDDFLDEDHLVGGTVGGDHLGGETDRRGGATGETRGGQRWGLAGGRDGGEAVGYDKGGLVIGMIGLTALC